MKDHKSYKQEKIELIRGLLDGSISPDKIEDRREVFFTDGVPSRYAINGKEVDRDTFDEIIARGPKDPGRTVGLGPIIFHDGTDDEGPLADERYWPPITKDDYFKI